MSDRWYEVVDATASLTQGDLIPNCPLLTWCAETVADQASVEAPALQQWVAAFQADVVVMTQACDLEHDKVQNVILCPHVSLDSYRAMFERAMGLAGQSVSAKAWKRRCDDIREGYLWNLAMLNAEEHPGIDAPHRIVDFHEVFTLPKAFLSRYLTQRGKPHLRLLPPYREHLSQAFARFFMRVGLPTPVTRSW